MKTLFLSTHELAMHLSADTYTCNQLELLLDKKTGTDSLSNPHMCCANIVMKMLFQEQKEVRDFSKKDLTAGIGCSLIEDFLGLEEIYLTCEERVRMRQRLISSLLIRPDRILCIPV